MFHGISPAHQMGAQGPSVQKSSRDLLLARTEHEKQQPHFELVIKLDHRNILQGRPRRLSWPIFLVTRILTRDLFAVANLLVRTICSTVSLLFLYSVTISGNRNYSCGFTFRFQDLTRSNPDLNLYCYKKLPFQTY